MFMDLTRSEAETMVEQRIRSNGSEDKSHACFENFLSKLKNRCMILGKNFIVASFTISPA
ncbi:MAG: hypothetical protein VX080_08750, partial [SAR324 cluster bacterium]|nr:hypothetical protein [SAR324 cluster bacterium]